MKVIKPFGPGDLRVVDVPMPEPAPGYVRVKVRASGICGSDKGLWEAKAFSDRVAGHEVAGEIDALGQDVFFLKPGDRVIISASAVPGNERTVSRVIDELFRRGAEVMYDKVTDLHVSGHAYQEELKMIIALTKPKFFMPMHGEHRHLRTHAKLAEQMGIPAKNILVSDIGQVIELTSKSMVKNGTVPSGRVLVDGTGVGDVGSVVLRDRQHLAQDGMIVVIVNLSSEDGGLVSGPDIITRGFIYVKESEEMMQELRDAVLKTLESFISENVTDRTALKSAIRADLSSYLYKKTKRNPMILPVVTEI
jgi:ribonuclease J